jgi:hypothetical protein
MLALVGGECFLFDQDRQQMELLAELKVTAKAVERVSENVGADIAHRQQLTIQQAMQLELPVAVGQATAVMYVQMDATSVPMVAKETEGRSGKREDGRAHGRDVKLGCVFTQASSDEQGRPVRDADSTTYTGAVEIASELSRRIYTEAHQRGWSRAQTKVVMGDGATGSGTLVRSSSPAPFRSWISVMPGSISGFSGANSTMIGTPPGGVSPIRRLLPLPPRLIAHPVSRTRAEWAASPHAILKNIRGPRPNAPPLAHPR